MIAMFGMVTAFTLFSVPLMPGIVGHMSVGLIFTVFGTLSIGMMLANTFVNMPIITSMQIRIPDAYRARFFSILTTFCMVAAPLGTAVIGVLVDSVSAMMLFLGGGAICLGVCFWMLVTPKLKEI